MFVDTPEHVSPLGKYDYFRRSLYNIDSKAAAFEHDNIFQPGAPAWFGKCDAWSYASIYRPEPTTPLMRTVPTDRGGRDIRFSVGDQKALLIKTFENVDPERIKFYGQRMTGTGNNWILPDMYADEMFRFVQVWLFQQHRAFVMDHDLKVENWNVPVFKGFFRMELAKDYPNAVRVYLKLYSPKPTDDKEPDYFDHVGLLETSRDYYFILRGTPDKNNWLTIEDGFYIKGDNFTDSRKQHPDYIQIIEDPDNARHWSKNTEVLTEVVDQILYNQAYDPKLFSGPKTNRNEQQLRQEQEMNGVTQ